jgi:soluble lytic murein transglycosylase-like protein
MMLSRTWIARLPLNLIYDIALDEEVPWTLLAAIVQTESGGDPLAVRFEPDYKYVLNTAQFATANNISQVTEMMLQKTSWGLVQVMGGVAREHGHKGSILELAVAEIGLRYGAKHLKKFMRKYPNKEDVIASYNAGSPVKGLDGKYKNQQYVDKVIGYLNALNDTFEYTGR